MSTVNVKALITATDEASKVLKGFSNNTEKASDNVRQMANKAALALGVAGTALTIMAKKATDFTREYVGNAKALARETGATVEEASALMHVTTRLGIETDKARQVFGLFSKKIVEGSDAFKQLNISTTDATGKTKSFHTILLETADRFAAMPDGVAKTALALDLFGRSGRDMIKVLNLGSEGIQKLEADAAKLGLTLTPGTVEKVAAYVRSQKDLKDSTDALKIAIGTATAPVLTEFNKKLNEILLKMIEMDGPMKAIGVNFAAFGGPVLTAIAALLAFGANITQVITGLGALGVTLAGFAGWAAFAGLAALAIGATIFWMNKLTGEWDKVTNAIIGQSNNAAKAMDLAKQKFDAGIISAEQFSARIRIAARDAADAADQATKHQESLRGFSGFQKFIGSAFRAEGGPVKAGQPYVVGEKGPELFMPNRSGSIVPNSKLGSSGNGMASNVSLNVNIGMFAGTPMERRQIARTLFKDFQDVAKQYGVTPSNLLDGANGVMIR